jgi:hypothetical protein
VTSRTPSAMACLNDACIFRDQSDIIKGTRHEDYHSAVAIASFRSDATCPCSRMGRGADCLSHAQAPTAGQRFPEQVGVPAIEFSWPDDPSSWSYLPDSFRERARGGGCLIRASFKRNFRDVDNPGLSPLSSRKVPGRPTFRARCSLRRPVRIIAQYPTVPRGHSYERRRQRSFGRPAFALPAP